MRGIISIRRDRNRTEEGQLRRLGRRIRLAWGLTRFAWLVFLAWNVYDLISGVTAALCGAEAEDGDNLEDAADREDDEV